MYINTHTTHTHTHTHTHSHRNIHSQVWSARLRKLRFSMDNMGLINRKPDAPKNVLERVVLQAVEGDNMMGDGNSVRGWC